jgi:SAM-dependent methyltransferase
MSSKDVFKKFEEGNPNDFLNWTALPESPEQKESWQNMNRAWWEKNPMRYDFTYENNRFQEGTKEFYEEVDRRFYVSVYQFMPWQKRPFDPIIDFAALRRKDVLEIGVGCGSNAQLLSENSGSFTGIDLTEYAVNATKTRFRCFGLSGNILRMDAEKMEFKDNSFDFIWSWGVIHHSSNTRKILEEIHRVLRPGGRVAVMVYHRSIWNTYVRGALYYGVIKGRFLKSRSLNSIIQQSTDGALARYYTVSEWDAELSRLFKVENSSVYGSKSQIIPLPWGRTKEFLMKLIPDAWGRFITNRPFMGFLLVSSFTKQNE